MLRACKRVLRAGGRIAFYTIQPTPGLDDRRRRKASRVGPRAVAVPTSYPSLLASAGFQDVRSIDVTAEYRATQQRWIDATARHAEATRPAMGDAAFEERWAQRHDTLAAIDDGVLSRFLYVGDRPGSANR